MFRCKNTPETNKRRFFMEQEQKQAITELAELLHKLGLSEIEYESNGVRLRIAGGRQEMVIPQVMAPASAPQAPVVQAPVAQPEAKAEEYIRSPMVGVAYLSKEENGPTFVKVGDTVSVGQTVCLVEAMKTFNPVKADKTGRIVKVLVEAGSPVEYNQPLFVVE
jgi:acetyl-CoA carboxylase biotin carboxyl carrier protein